MKWAFSIKNKLKASAVLLLMSGIILFSNYRLKRLSTQVGESVQTIYEDRLIVQDLIFSYSQILDYYDNADKNKLIGKEKNNINERVNNMKLQYSNTVLTEEEEKVFDLFSNNLAKLLMHENANEVVLLSQLKGQLQRLGQIQMEEAKRQMSIIYKARGSQEIVFYLETAILVILLVVVQILVISSTSLKNIAKKNDFNLN